MRIHAKGVTPGLFLSKGQFWSRLDSRRFENFAVPREIGTERTDFR